MCTVKRLGCTCKGRDLHCQRPVRTGHRRGRGGRCGVCGGRTIRRGAIPGMQFHQPVKEGMGRDEAGVGRGGGICLQRGRTWNAVPSTSPKRAQANQACQPLGCFLPLAAAQATSATPAGSKRKALTNIGLVCGASSCGQRQVRGWIELVLKSDGKACLDTTWG